MADTVEILRRLIAFDTTSRNSNMGLISWVADYLETFGARVRLTHNSDRTKANLLATIGPEQAGGVVLSGHTDVVPVDDQIWASDPFILSERAGKLYGRGTSDMKGFIASCLAAAPRWTGLQLQKPIHLALSYDEEIGCLGAPHLIDDLIENLPLPAFAVIGEPTDMKLGVSHSGVHGLCTCFKGMAAHASDPTLGVNAIDAASGFIQHLGAVQKRVRAANVGGTLNVGGINGGTATNIVAERCDVRWEYRATDKHGETFIQELVDDYLRNELPPGVLVASELKMAVPQFQSNFDTAFFEILKGFGAQLPLTRLPFGSEAGLFEAASIPAIVCGPGSIDQAHRPDEWIERSSLSDADAFMVGVGAWASKALN
jgi:acetylornithine deacetylase